METTTESLEIRALNPDDDSELRQVAALYQHHQELDDSLAEPDSKDGTTSAEVNSSSAHANSHLRRAAYPFPQLTQTDFWRNHAGQRFISLTIRRNSPKQARPIVAQLGVREDEFRPQVVEILFPAVSPDLLSGAAAENGQIQGLRDLVHPFLGRLASRKGWQTLVAYLPAAVPGMTEFAREVLGLQECAILPLHRPEQLGAETDSCVSSSGASSIGASPRPQYEGDVVAFAGTFGSSALDATENIFAPALHLSELQRIATSTQAHSRETSTDQWIRPLNFVFRASAVSSASPLETKALHSRPSSDSTLPLESRLSRRLAARITTVDPKTLSTPDRLVAHVNGDLSRPHFLSIVADTPSAGVLGSLIEDLGFCFCGVLPAYRGAAHLVFARHPRSESPFVLSAELRHKSPLGRYLDGAATSQSSSFDRLRGPHASEALGAITPKRDSRAAVHY